MIYRLCHHVGCVGIKQCDSAYNCTVEYVHQRLIAQKEVGGFGADVFIGAVDCDDGTVGYSYCDRYEGENEIVGQVECCI